MSIPLLAAVDNNYKISIFIFLVLVTFILSSLLPTVFALLKWQYNVAIQIPITAGYILYVLLGYIIKNCDFNRTIRFIAYGFVLVGCTFIMRGQIDCLYQQVRLWEHSRDI